MRQRRFMRGALGRELQTFGGTSFLLGLLSSSSLPLLLASSPASFSYVIRVKSLRARLRTSFLVGEPFRLVNEAISPNIFHQHLMAQSPKCCITNVFAMANVSNIADLFLFLVKTFQQNTILCTSIGVNMTSKCICWL